MSELLKLLQQFRQMPQQIPDNILEPKEDKTGYDYLAEMCSSVRNETSAWPALSGNQDYNCMTPRVQYIITQLNDIKNINYKVVPFHPTYVTRTALPGPNLVNIQVEIKATKRTKKTIIFSAHHDIANPDSENCQDNTASVCNLIDLCGQVSRMRKRDRNVVIVFTDCEEMGGKGANKIISQVQAGEFGDVEAVISLELTANGTELWAEGNDRHMSPIMNKFLELSGDRGFKTGTPYNENQNIRRAGIDGICIGILPKDEVEAAKAGTRRFSFYPTWSLCHSPTDTFDKSANKKDMTRFVRFMKRFINN